MIKYVTSICYFSRCIHLCATNYELPVDHDNHDQIPVNDLITSPFFRSIQLIRLVKNDWVNSFNKCKFCGHLNIRGGYELIGHGLYRNPESLQNNTVWFR